MTIQTISITGDAILFTAKNLRLPVPEDAECQFVRVDQNTREVFIDYSTNLPTPSASSVNEAAWRVVDGTFYTHHLWDRFDSLNRQWLSSTRTPCLRPPGCADEWYTSK